MEEIIIRLLMNGGPSGIIVGIGLWIVRMQINGIRDDLAELKTGKQWVNLCDEKHSEVNRRIERIENIQNGS